MFFPPVRMIFPEEKSDNLGILDTVNETGELLGFIFDVFEIKGNDHFVEIVYLPISYEQTMLVRATFGSFVGSDTGTLKRFHNNTETIGECLLVTYTG